MPSNHMRKTSFLFLILFSAASLSQNSTQFATPKISESCFYADAAKEITGKWTITTWSIYGTLVYGVVPIVSEIAIAFIIARLSSSTQNPPNGNPTEDPVVIIPIGTTLKSLATTPGINKIADMINTPSPSVSTGHRIALAIVNLFRSPTNSGTASSPGLPVRDIITVGLFITTLGAYVTELFMRAHCNSENQ